MLCIAQEDIGRPQALALCFIQYIVFSQLSQNLMQRLSLQAAVSASTNQLECLGDKFYFANTPRAELDIVLHPSAANFAVNSALGITQGLDGAVI